VVAGSLDSNGPLNWSLDSKARRDSGGLCCIDFLWNESTCGSVN
jgi:hypothetical protein